jgi:molybdopterin molybdotransferase
MGEAARVHTGGMIPRGADAVVMVENTQALDEQTIEVVRPVAVGEHVIPIGEDVRTGDLLFPRGHWLRPQDLGGLAGVGITIVPVVARPRVAILATGDEVVPAEQQPVPGQIRDINTYTIAALTLRAGGDPLPTGIAPDSASALREIAADALAAADVLIVSAGSSVSTRDMTAQVIGELGHPGVLVHGVSIHPGKPTILAVAGGKAVFGLPGNPVSTMIAFELFVAPTLLRLLGCARPIEWREVQARLARNVASIPGREDFVPVRLEMREGQRWAEPVFGKSNLIYTMARADGVLHVPLDMAGLYAGDVVTVRLF